MSVTRKIVTTITCDFCGTSFNADLQEYPCIDGEYAVFHLDFRCSIPKARMMFNHNILSEDMSGSIEGQMCPKCQEKIAEMFICNRRKKDERDDR